MPVWGRILLDFGTAEAAESGESAQEEVFGTVEYFSPEQAKGEKTDKYTDIYSMGILLYELMTGKLPLTGEEKVAIALKQIHQTPGILPACMLRIFRIV